MIKVAIFVEGQGEQIFVTHLITNLIDQNKFSFECLCLRAQNLDKVRCRSYKNEYAEVHFLIINAQGDGSVLPAIKKREKGLFAQGYHKIIGLRDMYSQAYREISPGVIDNSIIQQFIDGANNTIASMSQPAKIHFHFAIMELEAWWLCISTLFSKIDKRLTVDFIKEKLGKDLSLIDAEQSFFHPASKVSKILNFVGRNYEKHFSEVESIISHIIADDLIDVIMSDEKRCESFKIFCENLIEY